ncbi:head completion/stabilization protein [Methylovulum psychrotolerans]|uniref:Head completion/stabilization protein n=1 Tax=Methylovulum psychrotolerans TaxID=1704499 RepID=A0A2S5CGK7_9GAMM|nr:head completion/stabilization protein [Methylovulum psychrotolerans]POZ49897.1 hypothetical protein AADEFJLK_04343 [Methylovulum psychrotolerans]
MSFSGKPANTTAQAVTNDGFWPDLTVGDLVDDYRIPTEYADAVVLMGLKAAMVFCNKELAAAKLAIIGDYDTLALYCAANSSQIDGDEVLHFYYVHAVCCYAKAFLLQQFNSLNRKPNAENAAKEAPQTEEYWMQQCWVAINNLLGSVLPEDGYTDPRYARVTLL